MTTDKITPLRQLQAYAHIDGAKMALLWIAGFVCFILEISHPILGLVWLLSICLIPIYAYRLLKTFRSNQPYGTISFGRAWLYVTYTFFYSTLLFALAQYIYFAFIDNGFLISQYVQIMSDPAYKTLFEAYGYTQSDLDMFISQLHEMTPIGIALNFASMNFLTGMILGLPLAAIVKKK